MDGFRAQVRANDPGSFIEQYLKPLFFRKTSDASTKRRHREFTSAKDFWANDGEIMLREVRLKDFRLTDWFPRAPGVYWSREAERARDMAMAGPTNDDPYLGRYFSPRDKMGLIERGGIGSLRLLPRKIDDHVCWLGTALSGTECHQGVPLAIPKTVMDDAGVEWGDRVTVEGRVRFLKDAGLDDAAGEVHHARPVIVFVDKLSGVTTKDALDPIIISPVALFEHVDKDKHRYDRAQYTFVQCAAGIDDELDAVGEWIGRYAEKHSGRVITNFDEQRPVLADAPLSYQRLVARTYDKTVIQQFNGDIKAERIDLLVRKSVVQFGDTHVKNNINVGGSAIINIDSVLNNVNQTIGGAPGLNEAQKSQLDSLVTSLKSDLEALKASHADEVQEIASALEKAVANAAKSQQERKKSLLELSAKGLKEAAELVKDVAPAVLLTAGQIAKFIAGLP
jgi:hypothetical protein